MEAEHWQLLCRYIISGFWALTITWALMTRKKLQNLQKITLHDNCQSTASIGVTKAPKEPFLREWTQLPFLCRICFLKKCFFVALDDIEVKIYVLLCFLSARSENQNVLKGLGNIGKHDLKHLVGPPLRLKSPLWQVVEIENVPINVILSFTEVKDD